MAVVLEKQHIEMASSGTARAGMHCWRCRVCGKNRGSQEPKAHSSQACRTQWHSQRMHVAA